MSSSTAADANAAAAAAAPAGAPETPASNKDWLADVATQLEAEAGNLPDEMQAVKAKLASSAQQLRAPEAAAVVKELEVKKQVKSIKDAHGSAMEHMQKLKNEAEVANAKYMRHKKERDRVDAITKGTAPIKLIGWNFEAATVESLEHTSTYTTEEMEREAMRLDTLNAETERLEEKAKDAKKAVAEYRKADEFSEAKDAFDAGRKLGRAARDELATKVNEEALEQRAINTKHRKLNAKVEAFHMESKLENAEKNVVSLTEQNLALNAKVSNLESKHAELETRHNELIKSNETAGSGGDSAGLQAQLTELENEKKGWEKTIERAERRNKKMIIANALMNARIRGLPNGEAHLKALDDEIAATIQDAEKSKAILDAAAAARTTKRKADGSAGDGSTSAGARKRPGA